jgi:hypothetical protein
MSEGLFERMRRRYGIVPNPHGRKLYSFRATHKSEEDKPAKPTGIGIFDIAIQDIWLMREDNDVVVYVQREGKWYEAIREPYGYNHSHCITASGLADCKLATWLEDGGDSYE